MNAAAAARVATVCAVMSENERALFLATLIVVAAVDDGKHPRELAREIADSEQWDVYDGAALRDAKRSVRNARRLYHPGVAFVATAKRPQG